MAASKSMFELKDYLKSLSLTAARRDHSPQIVDNSGKAGSWSDQDRPQFPNLPPYPNQADQPSDMSKLQDWEGWGGVDSIQIYLDQILSGYHIFVNFESF